MPADQPTDPYPLMRLDYALEALKLRFTADRVIEETGRVILKLEHPGQPALVFVSLTVEQAKVLVAHPISAKELVTRIIHQVGRKVSGRDQPSLGPLTEQPNL